ncbi:MAG: TlyA family RNA methyltransferase [Acidimicrobiales bacterium]|nr:TlyA family RNA methyltransferase [Acidimicrobiales bacterium]
MTRRRLDQEMVRRRLAESLDQAAEFIEAGRVTVDGAPADKPTRLVEAAQAVVVMDPPPKFVSRGGLKLEAALAEFALDPTGLRAIDAGSSTGGFTDCLLQHGAATVTALDVGRGQLHQRLRTDERVTVCEQTNIRHADPVALGAPFDLLVTDLSFISLRTVMSHLVALVAAEASLVMLVKPQFEANKAQVDLGKGVITDPEVWREVLNQVETSVRGAGAAIMGGMVSPITGAEGNVEFLIHVIKGGAASSFDAQTLVTEAASR